MSVTEACGVALLPLSSRSLPLPAAQYFVARALYLLFLDENDNKDYMID